MKQCKVTIPLFFRSRSEASRVLIEHTNLSKKEIADKLGVREQTVHAAMKRKRK